MLLTLVLDVRYKSTQSLPSALSPLGIGSFSKSSIVQRKSSRGYVTFGQVVEMLMIVAGNASLAHEPLPGFQVHMKGLDISQKCF
jgi:hypothetical protein